MGKAPDHTHTPYEPGCRHCVVARAIRRKHPKRRKHNIVVPDVDGSVDGPTKISMDYMYLNERGKESQDEISNPPHLVVIEHRHGRVWAHRLPQNGVLGKVEWVPRRVIRDLANSGMQSITIQVKFDQEAAMLNVQIVMQGLHPDRIIPLNSPVGESECNGRIENAIRRVQEK